MVKNGGDLVLYHGIYLQGQRSKADFFRLKVEDTFFVVKENDFLAKSAITSRTSVVFLAQQPNLPSSCKTSKCKQTLSKVKYVNSMFFCTMQTKSPNLLQKIVFLLLLINILWIDGASIVNY